MAIALELLSSLLLFAYCLRAFALLVLSADQRRARAWITEGCLFALTLKLGATLLKTLILTTWNQLGLLAALGAIRITLAQFYAIKMGALEGPPNRRS